MSIPTLLFTPRFMSLTLTYARPPAGHQTFQKTIPIPWYIPTILTRCRHHAQKCSFAATSPRLTSGRLAREFL